jgi:biotin-(acetyl-CoA carboxylase) ligase
MRNRIKSRELGAHHTVYDLTDSTMNDMNAKIADTIARGKDIHGHVIQALQQTNGRGSTDIKTGLTRAWESQEGNLLFSMAVNREGMQAVEVYLLGILATLKSINSFGLDTPNLTFELPNDVLINGKKVCGILASEEFCHEQWCNLGVGVNISYAPEVKDKRNISGCLKDCGWNKEKPIEDYLKVFLDFYKDCYQNQKNNKFYLWHGLGFTDKEGYCYAHDMNKSHGIIKGQVQGFELGEGDVDFVSIIAENSQQHRIPFRGSLISPKRPIIAMCVEQTLSLK